MALLARDREAGPGLRDGWRLRSDDALAGASAAVMLLVVAGLSLALAAVASSAGGIAARAVAACVALAGGLAVARSAARGGGLEAARAADVLAVVLVAADLAVARGGGELALAALVMPVAHAAAFQHPRRVGLLALGAVGLALAATIAAGGAAGAALAWTAPALAAVAAVSLSLHRLRSQRSGFAEGEAEARRLADEDGLTGVANYRAFWRTLHAEVARAQRHGQMFTLITLDLDNFKLINDEHGHLVGDAALREAAGALRGAVRTEDLVCRQGGDEFAVIAVAAGREEAAPLAERLVAAVAGAGYGRELPWRLRASAGWATFGEPARSAETLVEHAEAALREAKRGRSRPVHVVAPGAVRSAGASALRGRERDAAPAGARPAARLTVLANLARALAAVRTERAIAETAIAHVVGAVGADRVTIVRQGQGGALALVAVTGGRGLHEPREVESQPPLSTALLERRPVVHEPSGSNGEAHAGPAGVRLALPLLADGRVWGGLEVESHGSQAYVTAEIELLEAMTETVASALAVAGVLSALSAARWDSEADLALATQRSDAHGREVARLADRVGRQLGLRTAGLRALYVAALFHEIGTVCAPPAILRKQGQLTSDEFAALRPHPLVGERLLGGLPGLDSAAEIVRAERERYDGGGYPDGLAGEQIPLSARILHACDAFVAMTTTRPYRPSLSPTAALEELRRNSASQFDPAVVDTLIDSMNQQVRASTA